MVAKECLNKMRVDRLGNCPAPSACCRSRCQNGNSGQFGRATSRTEKTRSDRLSQETAGLWMRPIDSTELEIACSAHGTSRSRLFADNPDQPPVQVSDPTGSGRTSLGQTPQPAGHTRFPEVGRSRIFRALEWSPGCWINHSTSALESHLGQVPRRTRSLDIQHRVAMHSTQSVQPEAKN